VNPGPDYRVNPAAARSTITRSRSGRRR
jgi:hypothetical protein